MPISFHNKYSKAMYVCLSLFPLLFIIFLFFLFFDIESSQNNFLNLHLYENTYR